jgi:hypothetical protein
MSTQGLNQKPQTLDAHTVIDRLMEVNSVCTQLGAAFVIVERQPDEPVMIKGKPVMPPPQLQLCYWRQIGETKEFSLIKADFWGEGYPQALYVDVMVETAEKWLKNETFWRSLLECLDNQPLQA